MAVELIKGPAPAGQKPERTCIGSGDIDYEETGRRMAELLSERGWCILKCSNLGGDSIVIVAGEHIKGYPPGYPIYNESELAAITSSDQATMKLLHEAKKEGAKIEEVRI